MKEYSFTEAQQHFASVLNEAKKEGIVCVKQGNGNLFYIKAATSRKSPLDVEGVDLGMSATEIVGIVSEGREKLY